MSATSQGYHPKVIANYLLDFEESKKLPITQLKLLKLYYFVYACYLTEKKKPLAKNDIEAWKYGPVSRSLRKEFSKYGSKPIKSRALIFDIYTGEKTLACTNQIKKSDRMFIDGVLKIYDKYTGSELLNLTHEEGSPWDIVWNGKDGRARLGMRIKDKEIIEHFT